MTQIGNRKWTEAGLPALLALAAGAVCVSGNWDSEFWWPDAARHGMDGVFVLDWVRDLPGSLDVYRYAAEYYARYPALGLVQYPPLFPVAEALFFTLFGINVTAARLAVASFAALGAAFGYRVARRFVGPVASGVAVLVVFTAPGLVPWARDAMLEVPVVAMMLAATHFFLSYVEGGARGSCFVAGGLLALAVMTKQTACLLVPIWAGYAVWRLGWGVLKRREVLLGAALCLAMLAPLVVLTWRYARVNIGQSVGDMSAGLPNSRTSWLGVTYYLRELGYQLGWPALVLVGATALAGIARAARGKEFLPCGQARRGAALGLLWLGACWAVLTFVVAHKNPRFIAVWLPGWALVAAAGVESAWRGGRLVRGLGWVAAAVLAVQAAATLSGHGWLWGAPPPMCVRGPDAAAGLCAGAPRGTVVFYSGLYEGNFVFGVRRRDPQRRIVVLRGTKMLVALATEKEHGMKVLVDSEEGILDVFRRYGVRYVLLEEPVGKLAGIHPVFTMLGRLVRGPRFSHCGGLPLHTTAGHAAARVEMYEFLEAGPATAQELAIELLAAGLKIRVPLERLGVPTAGRPGQAASQE